jgi:hypothetical protein
MAIKLEVRKTPAGGELYVFATGGDHVAIIDNIILSIDFDGSTLHIWFYQEDFDFGSGRVGAGMGRSMFETPMPRGPAIAHATAEYWDVDQSVKSLGVDIP